MSGLEIYFAKLLISVIHERAFKTSTTYPLACMIFQLCRDARVSICNLYSLRTPARIAYIILMRDEAYKEAPRRGPRVGLQPLSENLVETVELSQGDDFATSKLTDTTPS